MKAVLVAAAFLTRVPVPVIAAAADVKAAVRWFPLVGAAIGGVAALMSWILRDVLAVPPALTATLVVVFGAWVTGAIHLDGLADMADGFGGGRTREDVLRIMADPVIGSFGATALLLIVATKVAAITALLERDAARPFLVAAPAIARWTVSLLAAWLPYARSEGGLGLCVVQQPVVTLLASTMLTATVGFAALRDDVVVVSLAALLVTLWMGRAARHRIGGVTGDVFGASVELTEAIVLVSGVVLTGRP
jgi:cobalamin 5'-phosphate synthase/cobalamin synthase